MPWADPATFRLTNQYVVSTQYLTPKGEDWYEVHVAPSLAKTVRPTVLGTRELWLYEQALDAEGSGTRYDVSWHRGHRPDGKPCDVVTAIEPVEVTEIQV